MTENTNDRYEYFGIYPNFDAKLILDAFVKNNINFDIHVDDSQIREMHPLQAAYGGTFGQGVGIAVLVHVDDIDEAMRIQQQVLKIE